MKSWHKAAALVATLALAGGVTAAAQGGGSDDNGSPAAPRSSRILGSGLTENKYIPITPCRIVDTRIAGGRLAVGTARHVAVKGSGAVFAAQGGQPGGCGIPTAATSLDATVTAVQGGGTGYLRVYPSGTAEPAATFLNFTSTFNPTNTGNVKLGCLSVCVVDDHLEVRAHDATAHLVIDVQGYSVAPMAAMVSNGGELQTVRSSRAVSAAATGAAGNYAVVFDRDVSGCSYSATVSNAGGDGFAVADPRLGVAESVFVQTFDTAGAATNRAFYLQVTC